MDEYEDPTVKAVTSPVEIRTTASRPVEIRTTASRPVEIRTTASRPVEIRTTASRESIADEPEVKALEEELEKRNQEISSMRVGMVFGGMQLLEPILAVMTKADTEKINKSAPQGWRIEQDNNGKFVLHFNTAKAIGHGDMTCHEGDGTKDGSKGACAHM